MTDTEKQKILMWLKSLAERARILREEADKLEVIPRVRIAGYIDTPLENVGLVIRKPIIAEKMSEEFKKSFMRSYKYGLTGMRNHFCMTYQFTSSSCAFWDKNIEKTVKEFETMLVYHEEMKDKLFRRKEIMRR